MTDDEVVELARERVDLAWLVERQGLSRRQRVLFALAAAEQRGSVLFQGGSYVATDGWLDGPSLCNAAIGGTEGARRVRELRQQGFTVVKRRKQGRTPNPNAKTFQYRLVLDG